MYHCTVKYSLFITGRQVYNEVVDPYPYPTLPHIYYIDYITYSVPLSLSDQGCSGWWREGRGSMVGTTHTKCCLDWYQNTHTYKQVSKKHKIPLDNRLAPTYTEYITIICTVLMCTALTMSPTLMNITPPPQSTPPVCPDPSSSLYSSHHVGAILCQLL